VTALLFALLLHESAVSSSRLEIRGNEARVIFTFSLEDLSGLARLDADRDGVVDSGEWKRALPVIWSYVGEHYRIEACRSEGHPAVLPNAVSISDGRSPVKLSLRYVSFRPLDRLNVRCDLFREHGGNPRHVAEFPQGRTVVFDQDRGETDVRVAQPGFALPWSAAAAVVAAALIGFAARRFR
jgi:hypothetical protein